MKIISHRGYWKSEVEKNREIAFRRSFDLAFGTETDVRDYCGKLVISHDMPTGNELELDAFLEIVDQYESKNQLTLAFNVKSDGLVDVLKDKLGQYQYLDCFFFDMSIPDMRSYIKQEMPVFSRVSEYEKEPAFASVMSGIWLDSFETDWFDNIFLEELSKIGKPICVVSPELHKRDHLKLWAQLKEIEFEEDLILCTDYPEEAHSFFIGETK
jgi:glycerophosphoryl diester phosphodiesterase